MHKYPMEHWLAERRSYIIVVKHANIGTQKPYVNVTDHTINFAPKTQLYTIHSSLTMCVPICWYWRMCCHFKLHSTFICLVQVGQIYSIRSAMLCVHMCTEVTSVAVLQCKLAQFALTTPLATFCQW